MAILKPAPLSVNHPSWAKVLEATALASRLSRATRKNRAGSSSENLKTQREKFSCSKSNRQMGETAPLPGMDTFKDLNGMNTRNQQAQSSGLLHIIAYFLPSLMK